MKRKVLWFSIVGAIFTGGVGTLLHFLYELTGNNTVVALFSAVNESTWEHLKLFFMPFFLFTLIEYFFYGKHLDNFFSVKLISALSGMVSTVVLFYTYTGIIGRNIGWLNILIFFISVIFAYVLSYTLLIKAPIETTPLCERVSLIAFFVICALFFVFTFMPPRIALFRSPDDMSYGINKSK